MIGYLYTGVKKECLGCGACYQACPREAIKMEADNEGFLYPIMNELACVSCDLCHKVCPVEITVVDNQPKIAFVGFNKNEIIRNISASGGTFHAITNAVGEDAIVFGAEWDGRSCVRHAAESAKLAYKRFYKSKYIQSEIGKAYIDVKAALLQRKTVVFTGTPCQNAGLKAYLGEDYSNLFCIDLVCHGTPSGKVLEAYFKDIESEKNPIKSIEFRYKQYTKRTWESKSAKILYESGKEKIVDYDSSGFLRGFANGLFFRPSCSICPYAQQRRVTDLTIGDAWGVEKIEPDLNVHQGVSLILVNTEKGETLIKKISEFMQLKNIDIQLAIQGNARLRNPDSGHEKRNEFFACYQKESFERIVQRCIPRILLVKKIGCKIKKLLKRGFK